MLDYTGLLEPQKDHALNLLNSLYFNGVAADTSETGCGKTYAAGWVAKQFNAPIVVVCPKSVFSVWTKVLAAFGVKASILINYEKLTRGNTPHLKFKEPTQAQKDSEQEIWRYQLVDVKFPTGALVILDESHRCNGVTSLNCGLMISLKRKGYKVLSLSATQATNVTNMRAFGYLSNLHNLYRWRSWCLEHGAEDNEFGTLTFDSESIEAQNKMKACHVNLTDIQHVCSRLTRKDMGALFPENNVKAEAFNLGSNDPKIQAVYDEMEYEIALLEEGTQDYSRHVFAEIMKARRKAEMLKIPLIQEMVEDLYEEGNSPVVFLNFTESIIALNERLEKQDRFKGKIGLIYGDQSHKERDKDIDDFQADKKRIMIANLKAGGIAISLHDLNGKYPRASLISPSFSAIDIIQALGRICRQGGLTKCYQRIIFAANCIEEKACYRFQSRSNNLSCLVDGDLRTGFRLFED
jgi:hypothetical protein